MDEEGLSGPQGCRLERDGIPLDPEGPAEVADLIPLVGIRMILYSLKFVNSDGSFDSAK